MGWNAPPNWPQPPAGWTPPEGWQPDPAWGPPPEGWQFWSPDPPAQYGPGGFVSDKTGKPAQLTIAWVLTVCTLGYMLPWAIAATRGKSNAGAIGWLNLLLGWTFIGWIVALAMACGAHQKAYVPQR